MQQVNNKPLIKSLFLSLSINILNGCGGEEEERAVLAQMERALVLFI